MSIAAHLSHLGIPTRVFGEPMGTWRHQMPSGMFLKSAPSASNLSAPVPGFTLRDFCIESGVAPPSDLQSVSLELFVRYGRWFQERLVPSVERVRVRQLARAGRGFELILESGEAFQAGAVVVATGLVSFAYVPPELTAIAPGGPSAAGRVSHACQHRDLSTFARQDVAVIGAGQSALESAALLGEAGASAHLLVRGKGVRYASPPGERNDGRLDRLVKPQSPLGPGWSLFSVSRAPMTFRHLPSRTRLHLVRSILGPSGAWWLRERVEGRVDARLGYRVAQANLDDGKVVLHLAGPGGHSGDMAVDHVIACTGYRVDLNSIGFLEPSMRAQLERVGGSPRLTARLESSVPGLFFTGLAAAATFGPLLRFVCGTDFASRRVSAALASRAERRVWG